MHRKEWKGGRRLVMESFVLQDPRDHMQWPAVTRHCPPTTVPWQLQSARVASIPDRSVGDDDLPNLALFLATYRPFIHVADLFLMFDEDHSVSEYSDLEGDGKG